MSFLFHLKTLLGSKVAALAGATVLLGSGAAIANPASPEPETLPASDNEGEGQAGQGQGGQGHDEDQTEEAEEAAEDPADEFPADQEELEKTDAPEQIETLIEVTPDENANGEERPGVAEAVHEALSGGLSPGDEGFGQAVAENARSRGGNGPKASAAARGANGSVGRGPGAQGAKNGSGAADHGAAGVPQGRGPDGAGPPGHAKGR